MSIERQSPGLLDEDCEAVVFDMDGTLIDSEGNYCAAYVHAVGVLGGSLTEAEYYGSLAGTSNEHAERILVARLEGVTLETMQRTWREEFYRLEREEGVRLQGGARELLELLAEASLPLAVASSADLVDIERSIRDGGIAHHFSATASGEEVEHSKPAPDVFLLAAERLGVDPVRCLAFEDTNAGARAAIAAGMTTVMIPNGCEPDAHVQAHAQRIATSMTEIVEELRAGME